MPKVQTDLDRIANAAALLLIEHREHEQPAMKKLSADAFRSDAVKLAECNMARVEEIEALLVSKSEASQHLGAMINSIRKLYLEPNFGRPHPDAPKITRIACDPDRYALAEMAALKISAYEACAVAAVRATIPAHAAKFGKLDDWDAHATRLDELQDSLTTAYSNMRNTWTARDLEDDPTLTPTQRNEGLSRSRFVRFPNIIKAAESDWPQRFVAAVAEEIEAAREAKKVEPAVTVDHDRNGLPEPGRGKNRRGMRKKRARAKLDDASLDATA